MVVPMDIRTVAPTITTMLAAVQRSLSFWCRVCAARGLVPVMPTTTTARRPIQPMTLRTRVRMATTTSPQAARPALRPPRR